MKRIVFTELPEVTGAELTDNSSNTPKLSATDNAPLFAGLDTNAPLLSATTNTPTFFEIEPRYHLWFTFDDPNYFSDLANLFDVAHPYISHKRLFDNVGAESLPRKRLPLEYYEDFFYPGEERFQTFVRRAPPQEKVNVLSAPLLSTIQQYYLDRFSVEDDYLSKFFETTLISEDIFYSDLTTKIQRHGRKPVDIVNLLESSLLTTNQRYLLDKLSSEEDIALLQLKPFIEDLYSSDLVDFKFVGNPRERVYSKDSAFTFGNTSQLVDRLYITSPLRKTAGKKDRVDNAVAGFMSRNFNLETIITPTSMYYNQSIYDVEIDWKPQKFDTVGLTESSLFVSNPRFFKDTVFNTDLSQTEFNKFLYDSLFSTDLTDTKPSLGKFENVDVIAPLFKVNGKQSQFLDKAEFDDRIIDVQSNVSISIPRLYSTFAYTGQNSGIPVFKTLPAYKYPIEYREYWRDNFSWSYPNNFPGRPEDRAGFMSGDEGRIYLEGTWASGGGVSGPYAKRWTFSTTNYGRGEDYTVPRWQSYFNPHPASEIHDSGGRRVNLYLRDPVGNKQIFSRSNYHWTGPTYWEILNAGTWGYISKQFGLVALHPKQYKEDEVFSGISLFRSHAPNTSYYDEAYAFFNDRTTESPDILFDMQGGYSDHVGVQSIFKNKYLRDAEDFFYEKDGGAHVFNGAQRYKLDKFNAEDTRHPHHIHVKHYTHFDFFDAEGSYPPLSYEYGKEWYALVTPTQGLPYIRLGFESDDKEQAYWNDIAQMVHTVFAKDDAPAKAQKRRIQEDLFYRKDSLHLAIGGATRFLKDVAATIDNGIVKFAYQKDLAIPSNWVWECVENCGYNQTPIYGWVDKNAANRNEEQIYYSDHFDRKADYVRNDFTDSVQHADSGTAFVEIYCSEAWSLESYVGEDGTHAAF